MRQWVGGLPPQMQKLPVDHRGFPVPWFVAWDDGKPVFPAMDRNKFHLALRQSRCWVCGGKLHANKAFVLGPMCCVNRINSEPPSHVECAEFSAQNCPFLSRPMAKRTFEGDRKSVAGIMIDRNPGCCAVWVTTKFKPFDAGNGTLFELGPPKRLEFYAQGRIATDAEIRASVASGLPLLMKASQEDGDWAVAEFLQAVERFDHMLQFFGRGPLNITRDELEVAA
jgi:hypothetical protein